MSTLPLNWKTVEENLRGFVYKRVKNKALAEDIVHDVFVKVQDKIQHLRENEKILGWIYQITRNTIVDHYRTNAKEIQVRDLNWESTPPNFNDCVSGVIRNLIPTLPDKYRIPFEMTELQNVSQTEVEKKPKLTYTAAKTRVQRARRMLRGKLEELLIVKTDGYGNVIRCESRQNCC